jgi:hypothetical protein
MLARKSQPSPNSTIRPRLGLPRRAVLQLIRKSAHASASLADAAGERHMRKTPKQLTTAPSSERRKRIALPIVKTIAEARDDRARRVVRLLTQHPKRDR